MPDKKISELTVVQSVTGDDVSILVRNGTDYQYEFSKLITYLSGYISTGNSFSFVTVLPQDNIGKNLDVAVNTTNGIFYQKRNNTWTEVYAIPASNTSAATAILYGIGAPDNNSGQQSDTYIDTANGRFYQKTSTAWQQVFSMLNGPAGGPGPKGDTGTPGANGKSLLNGIANPSNQATGTDGDFYLNTNSYTLFGPKTNGNWGSGVAIVPENFETKADKEYVDAQDEELREYINNSLAKHPTYTTPTASLNSPQTGNYEVGKKLNISLNLTFTKNDAGNASGCVIKKDNSPIASNNSSSLSFTDNDVILSLSAITYVGTISYTDGIIKKDTLPDGSAGSDYPTGFIKADAINSNALTFKGYYATWYGAAATAPGNPADVRLLSNSQLTSAGNTFTLNTGTSQLKMIIVTAPGKSLSSVVDLDALNAVITSEYEYQGTISANDAAGVAVNGFKLYIKTLGVPYSSSHRHQITLN